MSVGLEFRINRKDLTSIHAIFLRGQNINENVFRVTQMVAALLQQDAQNLLASRGVRDEDSAAVHDSMKHEVRYIREGATAEIGSSFVGYPKTYGDLQGSASVAAARGWATLAHRVHYGYYPGAPLLKKPWNPAAGRTKPNRFLIDAFNKYAKIRGGYLRYLTANVIDPILKTRRVS